MIAKQKITLIMGIFLALISVFMVRIYLDEQRKMAEERAREEFRRLQADQVAVLVAKEDIKPGAMIDARMLESRIFPQAYLQPQAVTSLARISGMVVIAPIFKGEQITLGKLSYAEERRDSLAMLTPIGKRAITISVDNIAGLAGMIRPGDYVDVIAMISVPLTTPEGKTIAQTTAIPLFQNILVLAIGQEMRGIRPEARHRREGREEERREVSPLITLALSPQEASLIAFVQEQGKIRLILRSPADAQVEPMPPANWETFLHYVMPPRPALEKPPVSEVTREVEIFRGLSREKMPLSK